MKSQTNHRHFLHATTAGSREPCIRDRPLTIGLNGNGITAGGLDLFDGGFGGVLGSVRDVVDDDLVSLGTDVGGDRFSQSTRGSRHQDYLRVVGHHVESAGGIGLGNSEARGGVLWNEGIGCGNGEGGGERKKGTSGELHGSVFFR